MTRFLVRRMCMALLSTQGVVVKFAVRHVDDDFEPWKADDWVTGMAIPNSNGKTPEDAARNGIAALQKAGEHRYNAAVENASRNGGMNARR